MLKEQVAKIFWSALIYTSEVKLFSLSFICTRHWLLYSCHILFKTCIVKNVVWSPARSFLKSPFNSFYQASLVEGRQRWVVPNTKCQGTKQNVLRWWHFSLQHFSVTNYYFSFALPVFSNWAVQTSAVCWVTVLQDPVAHFSSFKKEIIGFFPKVEEHAQAIGAFQVTCSGSAALQGLIGVWGLNSVICKISLRGVTFTIQNSN